MSTTSCWETLRSQANARRAAQQFLRTTGWQGQKQSFGLQPRAHAEEFKGG